MSQLIEKLDELQKEDLIRFRWVSDRESVWKYGIVASTETAEEMIEDTPKWAELPAIQTGRVARVDLLLDQGQTDGSWNFYNGPGIYGQRFSSLEVHRVDKQEVLGKSVSYSNRVIG